MARPENYEAVEREQAVPAIGINDQSVITFINGAFAKAFGWESNDLVGKSVITIMPEHMRDNHRAGISRFLKTEKPTILKKPLPLPILTKDGRTLDVEHYILSQKKDGVWRFAATITPQEEKTK